MPNCQFHDILETEGHSNIYDFLGPPITGPCGASYRPSENFAISSGHQPFLVEILVEAKEPAKETSPKCLGTIITIRHVLTVG